MRKRVSTRSFSSSQYLTQNVSSSFISLIKRKHISKDDTLAQLSSNVIIFKLYSPFHQHKEPPKILQRDNCSYVYNVIKCYTKNGLDPACLLSVTPHAS